MDKKTLLFKFTAIIIGFSLAFGMAEVAIRILSPQVSGEVLFAYDRELGTLPVPGQHGRKIIPGAYDFTYSNNSWGFRGGREYPEGKQEGLRVLLLGDSFTYGIGANDNQTFPYYPGKKLGTPTRLR